LAAGACALALPLAAIAETGPRRRTWTFDNLRKIGGHDVEVEGHPQIVDTRLGKATYFHGGDDGLFIPEHPLAGAAAFTIEAMFRPDGGAFEQRWLHLESVKAPDDPPGVSDTRMLFEIRVVEDQWYLDTFVAEPAYRKALIVPEKRHPVGRWHHVAQTCDGEVYRSFVDGQLQAEAPFPFTPQGPGRASVGQRLNRVSPFHGAVRWARFTPEALSPDRFRYPDLSD
jgi:hypothetical protein